MSFLIQPLPNQGFLSPPPSFPSFKQLVLSRPHLRLAGFNGPKDDGVCGIFHETTKENKGKKRIFGGFKYFPPMSIKDEEVSPLHVIFDLKGVFVGKEYFKSNHFLPPPFNLVWVLLY